MALPRKGHGAAPAQKGLGETLVYKISLTSVLRYLCTVSLTILPQSVLTANFIIYSN